MSLLRDGARGAFLGIVCAGCAVVSPPTVRTDRLLRGSQPAVIESPGAVVVKQATWEHHRLSAIIEQERLCHPVQRETVDYQKVENRTVRNVAANLIVGGLMAAVGGGLIGVGTQLSDAPSTDAMGNPSLSSQKFAYVAGGGAAVGGLAMLIYGIVQAARAGDSAVGEPRRAVEDRVMGAKSRCGFDPPPPGKVRLMFGEESVGASPLKGKALTLDIDSNAELLCSDTDRIGVPLRVVFASGKGGAEPLEIAHGSVDDCTRVRVGGTLLDAAAGIVETGTSPAQLAQAALSLSRFDALIAELPKEDPRGPALLAREAEIKRAAEQASIRVLQGAVRAFEAKAQSAGLDAAVDSGAELLALSKNVPGKTADVWDAVYGAVVTLAVPKGHKALPAIGRLMAGDAVSYACIADGAACPGWLDHAHAMEVLNPYAERLNLELNRGGAELGRAQTSLERKITEANHATLASAIAEANLTSSWCPAAASFPSVAAACKERRAQIDGSIVVLTASHDRLVKLRVARTAEAWKRNFPECRELHAVAASLEKLGRCDGACAQVRDKVRGRWEALARFTVADGELDPLTRKTVHDECQAAGCPVCP